MPPPSNPSNTTTTSPSIKLANPNPQPTRNIFDAWNSSSTGHQRAENRLGGSTSWRDSRNLKLASQFRAGVDGGGKRVADTVGAGSEGFGKDGRKANGGWEKGASGLRKNGQMSLWEVAGKKQQLDLGSQGGLGRIELEEAVGECPGELQSAGEDQENRAAPPREPQIFSQLCFYINGSTAPLVSDLKLKQLLASHGARTSISLGRRSVTHVILGTVDAGRRAGGGLSGSKIQKEIARMGGKGVNFVGVEWVIDSIKAGKRLPEARFSNLKLAPKTQGSVMGMFKVTKIVDKPAAPEKG
ncbi:hypothetical protein K402DRAFT_406105 [Aulographum hederae CBS 113979]|uniref:BRCT domain-containing protein n=1 Tax=Aulographum hederae CBS 113979 TaxID=1176131 RepID=A0A6G1GUL2_9PEZI|nr:hypothetical protein K402DRAFT_406105 [Aulographum hederae CBS 113979]